MFITINDCAKGKPFKLQQITDGVVAIHRIDMWIGYYNIYEDETCLWARDGENSQEFTVESGLYNFEELTKKLAVIDNLTITADKTKGLAEISVPAGFQMYLTEPVRYLLGIQEAIWLTGEYVSDRAVEFTPKRLLIYLRQISTTGNYENKNLQIQPSELLCSIPLSAAPIGSFQTIKFDNPFFKQLQPGVDKLDFDFKVEWGNEVRHELGNHGQPIDLLLEIK